MAVLTHGPYLHWVRDHSANVWFRLDAAGTGQANAAGAVSGSVTVDPADDFTGYVTLTGLAANTEYTYDLVVDGVHAAGPFTFRTMPEEGQPGVFAFIHESDHHAVYNTQYELLNQFLVPRRHIPVLSVVTGDYEPVTTAWKTLATRRTRLKNARTNANKNAVRATVPLVGIWDDHDGYSDNVAGAAQPAADTAIGQQVWREYWAGSPPWQDSRGIQQSFLVADCLFLLPDCRTFREGCPASIPQVFAPTYNFNTAREFGAAQLAWIKQELLDHQDAPFKFLVWTTTIEDNVLIGLDPSTLGSRESTGIYYRFERNDLMAFLRDNPACASGLFILTGDDHQAVVRHGKNWRYPQDSLPNVAPLSSQVQVEQSITTVKAHFSAEAGGLGGPWNGSETEIFKRSDLQCFGWWQIDTRGECPRLSCELISVDTQAPHKQLYQFTATHGGPVFPAPPPASTFFTDTSEPATTWTPQPAAP